MIQQR